jgi:hypothetical protein
MLPIAGGNYFRQIPHDLIKDKVDYWHRNYPAPFVMYFHVWELDDKQPKINAPSILARIRHYRNLGKSAWVVQHYLQTYSFASVADYLGVPRQCPVTTIERDRLSNHKTSELSARLNAPTEQLIKQPVTIVIPFFNEEAVLPYFANTLDSVEADLGRTYNLTFVFVDDGSSDSTLQGLHQHFDQRANCKVLSHSSNRGVAAALLTGIRSAETEIVCSMDCDCTYDPHELRRLIPALTHDVDMVTGSPYHPQGAVVNVPSWRLSLSRSASFLYRCVLHQKLYTYTSCFRVYRRSAVADLPLKEGGFLGVAELLGRLDLKGSTIREYPATLEVRLLGSSKMKILRTILGHLKLLSRLAYLRFTSPTVQPVTPQETSPSQAPAPGYGGE